MPAQNLKICLAHGGGLHLLWHRAHGPGLAGALRGPGQHPAPQRLSRRFYYDCLTHSEAALRMVIDTVGADRVVLGTDWPADMRIDWPVSWVLGLQSLTQEEKELILWKSGGRAPKAGASRGQALVEP